MSACRLFAPRFSGTSGSLACHAHSVRYASPRTFAASSSSASPSSASARATAGPWPCLTRICERADPDVLLAAAQRELGEIELGGRVVAGAALERGERGRPDLGVGVVEQPGQPRADPDVVGEHARRVPQHAGRDPAQLGIRLAGELEDRAERTRVAERDQRACTAHRRVRVLARERGEQRLEIVVGQRGRRRQLERAERGRRLGERLGEAGLGREQPRREAGVLGRPRR